jgi:hypothetical protein
MPFQGDEILIDLICGRDTDHGHWRGWFRVVIRADAL